MESQPQNPEFKINPENFPPCLSCIHHLRRSDHPHPNFFPILYCILNIFILNSVLIMEHFYTKVVFHSRKIVYHCLC